PVQYRIFDAVYRVEAPAEGCALVLIGDPKQAIYAFRGADIHTYLVARRACAGRLYTLNRNHRSTLGMVAAANRGFAFADQQADGAFLFGAGADSPVPFAPAAAKGREERFECSQPGFAPLNLWHLPAPEGKAKRGDERALIAASCASTIRRLLADAQAGFRQRE